MRTIRLSSGALFLMGGIMAADAGAAELKGSERRGDEAGLAGTRPEIRSRFRTQARDRLRARCSRREAGRVLWTDTVDIAILPQGQHRQADQQAKILTFPKELAAGTNPDVVYVAGASLLTEEPLAAKALMDFLASPEAKEVYEAKGLKTG